jgi:hypothetical protein
MNIFDQVFEALDAATHENDYPHEYDRSPADIVLEIHDWSGIEEFDPENQEDIDQGIAAVEEWRNKNVQA